MPPRKKLPLQKRRYAETRTAGAGGLGAALIALLHLPWEVSAAIAAAIALAPGVFTWLNTHGGVLGALRSVLRGTG